MDLRTVLIVLVVVLCIYLAWLVLRWRRTQSSPSSAKAPHDDHAHVFQDVDRFGAVPVGETPAVLPDDDDSVVSLSSRSSEYALAQEDAVVRTPRPTEPDASGFGFDALLEVRQMRHLVDDVRAQHSRLAEDVVRLREELSALRAASRVAPAYAEAVSMVQRGLDAQSIAERCGISVAEAELVRALSEQRGSEDDESQADENRRGNNG